MTGLDVRRQKSDFSRRKLQGVLGITLLVAACGGQSVQTVGQVTIYVHGPGLPSGGEDALIVGTLMMRDGCVTVGAPDFDAYPVVWPSGTSIIDDDPLTLRLPGGDELSLGEVVSGGGGFHSRGDGAVEVAIPDECLGDSNEVAVFNPDADLTVG